MSKLLSRSEQRLLKRIDKASARREALLQDGKLSLPSGLGKLAIIVSRSPDDGAGRLAPKEQHMAFLKEADDLKEHRQGLHQEVVVRPIAVMEDMKLDFADPEVTDIMLIGHGSINAMWTDGGRSFDWEVASKAASYLKQGKIEQRMCGNLPSKKLQFSSGKYVEELPHGYSVPLGTFAVSDLRNVIAAPGIVVPDMNPSSELFMPIFSADTNAAKQVADFNAEFGNTPSVIA